MEPQSSIQDMKIELWLGEIRELLLRSGIVMKGFLFKYKPKASFSVKLKLFLVVANADVSDMS